MSNFNPDSHLQSQPDSTISTMPVSTPDHESTTLHPHHKLGLRAQIGALTLNLDLTLTAPWTVIYGPSGSGKTTILRALAGLLHNSAEIRLTRQNLSGNPQDLTTLPPRERQIAYAPQQPSLFPHLTVAANVAFSQQSGNKSTSSQQDIHSLFHLEDLAHRFPRNLSGGEQQRVNLARAFAVPNQQLMLLDEPFTGIGRALRDDLLPSMRRWTTLHKIPVLSVTHDVEEALLLDADVIRLEEGQILAQGPAPQVLAVERARILNALR